MLRACRSSAGGLNHCGWVEELGGGGGVRFLNFLQLHLLVGSLALLHSFMVLRKHSLLVFDDVDLFHPHLNSHLLKDGAKHH